MIKKQSNEGTLKGSWGERLIADFFHSNFSNQMCFPNPKTTKEVEIADVLIWWNRRVFLVEVKTRAEGGKSPEAWARTKIREGVNQIRKNHQRLINRETINLHNAYYHVPLNYNVLNRHYGLLVLLCDESFSLSPTEVIPDLYTHELPIHVILWNDLKEIVQEIDTVPDLAYYLSDRIELLKRGAIIPLGRELHVLAAYKMGENKFDKTSYNFEEDDIWTKYKRTFATKIALRNDDNRYAEIFDQVIGLLPCTRKLYNGIPSGLYFAWEYGALARRARAIYGKKLKSVEQDFLQNRTSRKYATLNTATGNWNVFFFSREEPQVITNKLVRLVWLKLVKEINNNDFKYAAYGLAFQVSRLLPPRFIPVASAFNGFEEAYGYTPEDLAEAYKEFGPNSFTSTDQIKEYPNK